MQHGSRRQVFFTLVFYSKDSGCEFESQTAQMVKHEKNCEFRVVKCPCFSCDTILSLKVRINFL